MGENISNCMFWKGLISKICEPLLHLNSKTKKQINQLKMGKGPEYTFFKGDIQIANHYIKRYSTSLITKEM